MSDHRWSDLTAAYALGALDPEERSEFERHLAGCGRCRREVDSYEDASAIMAAGVPERTPPAELRDRLLTRIQAEAAMRSESSPTSTPRPAASPTSAPGRSTLFWPLVGVTAASLLAAVTAGMMLTQASAIRGELEEALQAARDTLVERDLTIDRQRGLLDTLLAPELSTATLTTDTVTAPRLQLFWNRDTNLVVVAAFDLPPAPLGRTYQLWGIVETEAPVSLGVFDVLAGETAVTLTASAADTFDLAAVTEEPLAGSPQPTSPPFLVGAWRHSD